MVFGPKYINYERKIEYNTLAKEAIKIKTKNETLSEEMRLLYVALTRSKEKLIITGIDKNLKKSLSDKQDLLEITKGKQKISKSIIQNAKCYLDWLELVYLNDKMQNILEVKEYNEKQIKLNNLKLKKTNEGNNENNLFENNKFKNQINPKNDSEVNRLLNWNYSYINSSKIEGKTSVSKITKKSNEINLEKTPQFLSETEQLKKSEIGTIMHLILQKLDFNKTYNIDGINQLIQKQVLSKIITKKQAQSINVEKIINFTKSNLYKKIITAKKIFKEQPFYTNIEIDGEKVLVQGVIDLYFIDKKDNITIVDYKTDNIKIGEENMLIERYKEQLMMYKKALEEATNKKITEVYIYSTALDKEICLQVM